MLTTGRPCFCHSKIFAQKQNQNSTRQNCKKVSRLPKISRRDYQTSESRRKRMLMKRQLSSRRSWLREGSKNTIKANIMWTFTISWTRKMTRSNSISFTIIPSPNTRVLLMICPPLHSCLDSMPLNSCLDSTPSDLQESCTIPNKGVDKRVPSTNTSSIFQSSPFPQEDRTLLIRWRCCQYPDSPIQAHI